VARAEGWFAVFWGNGVMPGEAEMEQTELKITPRRDTVLKY
jgi:hypothetical protein